MTTQNPNRSPAQPGESPQPEIRLPGVAPSGGDPAQAPRPEIPSSPQSPEIPAKPSRDVPQPDRERA